MIGIVAASLSEARRERSRSQACRVVQRATNTISRAMIYGSVLASFSVEDFSLDRFRALSPAEVYERFRAFKALTQFEDIALGQGTSGG